jgi:dipeptidyl aminopeptidase/acylaminoacyl peptidase
LPPDESNQGRGENMEPAWSPDGRWIAFASRRDGGDPEIYLMLADGTNPMRLTASTTDDVNPTWSPDGKTLAFAGYWNDPYLGHVPYLYRISDYFAQPLSVDSLFPQVTGGREPAFSPDGRKIVFTCGYGISIDVCVSNTDGSAYNQLTSGQLSSGGYAANWDGDWQPMQLRILLTYTKGHAKLAWRPLPEAVVYQIYRDGDLVGEARADHEVTDELVFIDDVEADPAYSHRYEVAALNETGEGIAMTSAEMLEATG